MVILVFLLQAVPVVQLTLPGIAGIILSLGMAVDANVLIYERVREELAGGKSVDAAVKDGYKHSYGAILDSNLTTLLTAVILYLFGTGPIRGFAVVHCLGILTSMFSAVVVSRALANLWYGRRKKLSSISIGQVWKPNA